jgi:hypothetical protein
MFHDRPIGGRRLADEGALWGVKGLECLAVQPGPVLTDRSELHQIVELSRSSTCWPS